MGGEKERERAESWKLYLAEVQPEETLDNFSILKYCAVLFASFFRRISVSGPAVCRVPPFPFELCALPYLFCFSLRRGRCRALRSLRVSSFPLAAARPIESDRGVCIALFPPPLPVLHGSPPRGSRRYYAKYFLPCFEEPVGNILWDV